MHAGPVAAPSPPAGPHVDAAQRRDLQRSTRDDGSVDAAFRGALADAVRLYEHMVTLRLVSARMVGLQRSEKVAFHSSSIGEEALVAASALAARESDWVFPGVRQWGAALVRGLPIATYMHHAFGSHADPAKGHSAPDHPPARRFRVAPASGIPGAHVPQAVGAAWAAKIKKDDVAAIAIFDESVSGAGDFHNALNFAGVFKPAVVFVCASDGAPRGAHASRRETFAASRERALAYGIASATVDGSDALAVLTVVRAALARAVAGKGATLVEAVTHPLTADAARLPADAWLRGDAELLSIGEGDPLVRLRAVLEREKLIDPSPASGDALVREIREAIDAAAAGAERAGPPATSTLFEDVYAEVPAHLLAQKESSPWRR
jgi:TPP-dependent pyruvate/acetoin dehydrogenase alpha subunit